MRLQASGRNPQQRKEDVYPPDRLLGGVDVSKAKPSACLGTQTTMRWRKLEFPHPREGFGRFAQTRKAHLDTHGRQRLLLAMAPSGSYGQALYERRPSRGYEVCLVHCQAVRNHRKPMQDGTRKTDAKDAARVFDLRRQGTVLLPVARALELPAAYRVMRRHMARKKRLSQLRNPLRTAMPLALPEGNPRLQALTPPTSGRFRQGKPTPEAIVCTGRQRFLEPWPPRRCCGQGPPEHLPPLYALAPESLGLKDPDRLDAVAITAWAHERPDALAKQHLWLPQALA